VAGRKAVVRFTANFESNLASIAGFWNEQGAPGQYAGLLDELANALIVNLEEHPRLGRPFLARSPHSLEVRERVAALQRRLSEIELREYLAGDYLVLYGVAGNPGAARRPANVYLLAIRHQRQLSFDFETFWRANRGQET
jgi:hypothetical protein